MHPRNLINGREFKFSLKLDIHKYAVVVHRHAGLPDVVFYVGSCAVSQIFDVPVWCQQNDAYRAAIAATSDIVMFEVVGLFTHGADAVAYATELRRELNPVTMTGSLSKGRVHNIDTGESFTSASIAARHYKISPSALSSHLNGRRGYETVHGMRFRRDYRPVYQPVGSPVTLPAAPQAPTGPLPPGTMLVTPPDQPMVVTQPERAAPDLDNPAHHTPSEEAAYAALSRHWKDDK